MTDPQRKPYPEEFNTEALHLSGTDVDPDRDGLVEALGTYQELADRLREYNGPLTANTLISGTEEVVGVDTSGAAVTVTLATALLASGREIVLKDVGGAAATNAITVDTEGTATIDGATSVSIASNYGAVKLVSDGSNWFGIADVSGGVI